MLWFGKYFELVGASWCRLGLLGAGSAAWDFLVPIGSGLC